MICKPINYWYISIVHTKTIPSLFTITFYLFTDILCLYVSISPHELRVLMWYVSSENIFRTKKWGIAELWILWLPDWWFSHLMMIQKTWQKSSERTNPISLRLIFPNWRTHGIWKYEIQLRITNYELRIE